MARRLIGTGVTNSQGIAVMNKDANGNDISGYTGVGAGKLQIVAESGNLVSEPYELYDCMFYDKGTTGSAANWQIQSGNGTKTVAATGTTLTAGTSATTFIAAPTSSYYIYNSPFTVEFDIVEVTSQPRFQIRDENNNAAIWDFTETGHYKIVYDGTTVSRYKDDVQSTSSSVVIGVARMGFVCEVGESLKVKEFMIY